jgi:hypothetical protein
MIEITTPWRRQPFYIGDPNYYIGDGTNNAGIVNPALTNLKADCPTQSSSGGAFLLGGSATVYNSFTESVTTWTSPTDYEIVETPRFEVTVLEGDYANAPWVGLAVELRADLQTDVTTYIGGVWDTTTTYSYLNYTYNFTTANYIPSPTDPNWHPPQSYTIPWGSTPAGPSYTAYKYEDLGGGDFRITYGYIVFAPNRWNYISVVPGDFEVG